jgi:phage head maturation protease
MADSSKPYGDVTYADPKNGKYPIDTEEHARAAWSYINKAENAAKYPLNGVTLSEVKDRIMAACKRFGIDVSGGGSDSSSRAESVAPYTRSFQLEDISVRTTRDGRIVDAYLAVFNIPAPIRDQDGEYDEELDPVVFNRAISDAAPQGNRKTWRVGVFYNHGMTIMGTPSDRHSMPVAVPMNIKTDGHGVRATDKYHRSQFCDEIVEGLESGAIPGYSFSGRFLRSNPLIPRGGFRRDRTGNRPAVRRMESTLREYGPTPFPAYADAAVLGVRSDSLMAAMMADPDMAMRMISAFRDGAPVDSPPLPGAPEWDSPPEDSPRLVRSGRSVKEEMQASRSAFLQRHRRQDEQ